MQSAAYRSHGFITPWYFHTGAARRHGGWWEFALPDWCRVRSVIPAWFTELWTMTVVLRAAWNTTPCLSLIHSALQRGRRRRTCAGARVTVPARGGDSLKNSKGGKETEWAIICRAKDSGADVEEARGTCGSCGWYFFLWGPKVPWRRGDAWSQFHLLRSQRERNHHLIYRVSSSSHNQRLPLPRESNSFRDGGLKRSACSGEKSDRNHIFFFAYKYFTNRRLNSLYHGERAEMKWGNGYKQVPSG